jgi:peptidoglycan/xylan/chitin deacetylase (PgdA/CDA1 family)
MIGGLSISKSVRIRITLVTAILVLLMYPMTYKNINDKIVELYVGLRINILEKEEPKIEKSDNQIFVSIMFDSGYKSVYENAYPILHENNFTASIGVIPTLVYEEEHMSYLQIGNLYMKGWDVLNQSYSNKVNMYDYCYELLDDIQRAKKWMDNKYLKRASNNVIIPYGEINPYLIPLLKESGYVSIRTSDNIILLNNDEIKYYEAKVINIQSDTTVDELTHFLKNASVNKKDALIIFNKIENNVIGNTTSYSTDNFRKIIEYIKDNMELYEVVNYSIFQ